MEVYNAKNIKKDIFDIVKNNYFMRFKEEQQYVVDERKNKVNEIIDFINSPDFYKYIFNDTKGKKMLTKYIQNLSEDQYKKPWSRLKDFQKLDRLELYFKQYSNSSNYNDVADDLQQKLVNKKYNKAISYNKTDGKIIQINSIEVKDNKIIFSDT